MNISVHKLIKIFDSSLRVECMKCSCSPLKMYINCSQFVTKCYLCNAECYSCDLKSIQFFKKCKIFYDASREKFIQKYFKLFLKLQNLTYIIHFAMNVIIINHYKMWKHKKLRFQLCINNNTIKYYGYGWHKILFVL